MNKKVLLVSIGFSPNVGGIETHFDDLLVALNKRGWKVSVLTYKPITTKAEAPFIEKDSKNKIVRIPWIGGFFYKLVNKPIVEFLYLVPPLFLTLPLLLLVEGKDVDVIHSHGLIAGFVSVFWAKLFGKRVITTTHSIYNFPDKGLYTKLSRWIFDSSDSVLTVSKQSEKEVQKLGVNREKINTFTYWIDLNKFKPPSSKMSVKKKLGWDSTFVALYVGRLVKEKGVNQILKAVETWEEGITLVVAGTGPLEEKVQDSADEIRNLEYLGNIKNDKLPLYYSAADLLIVPSVHEEGFGRVILESLACGTPVIGSSRGAIPEAMNESVGRLIKITPKNIKENVEYFYKNQDELKKLAKNSRRFAESRYSEKNVEVITKAYEEKN